MGEGVLIGGPAARTGKGRVYRWRDLVFWADHGRVRTINERSGEARSCSRKDFAQRALVFSDAVKLLRRPDERTDHQRLAALMTKCCRDAFDQGDPHSSRALRELLSGPQVRRCFGGVSFRNTDGGTHLPHYPDGTPFSPFELLEKRR